MKTYTYSYQNVRKPGRLRTAPAGAGKLAGYPNARTPGRPVGPPDHSPGRNPGRRNPGRNGIRPPPNGPPGPNGWTPERPVGPPDHSPGRNPGRRNPGRLRTPANLAGYPNARTRRTYRCTTRVGAYCIRPPNIPQGMNDHTRGRVFATDGGARWGVCCCASYTGTHPNTSTGL